MPLTLLSYKLAVLFALANADRSSDLAALDLRFRTYQGNGVRFIIPGLTKTRRSGPPKEAFYASFPEEVAICPVKTLKEYELRTVSFRPKDITVPTPLFLAVRRPHNPVKPATIGHWLKVMELSGMDTSMFSAHSTRGASTSKASVVGVSIGAILQAADWSTPSTFQRFYHRPLHSTEFGRAVLGTSQHPKNPHVSDFERYHLVN